MRNCNRENSSTIKIISMLQKLLWSRTLFVINRVKLKIRSRKKYLIRKWKPEDKCMRKCSVKNRNDWITSQPYSKWRWRSLNLSRDSKTLKWCSKKHSKSWKMLYRQIQTAHLNRINQKKDIEMENEGSLLIHYFRCKSCLSCQLY